MSALILAHYAECMPTTNGGVASDGVAPVAQENGQNFRGSTLLSYATMKDEWQKAK